jgi:hypothetical protein
VTAAEFLDRLEQAHAAAWDEVAGLCDGSRRWTMRVPVDEARDSDTVIATALTGGEKAAAALRAVLALADRLDEDWEAVMVGHDHDECLGDIIRSAVHAALGVETTEAGQ